MAFEWNHGLRIGCKEDYPALLHEAGNFQGCKSKKLFPSNPYILHNYVARYISKCYSEHLSLKGGFLEKVFAGDLRAKSFEDVMSNQVK